MGNSKRTLIVLSLAGTVGILLPFVILFWLLWQQTIATEEERLGRLSEELATQTEQALVDAMTLLETLNDETLDACSEAHLVRLQDEALARTHVRALGYWKGVDRLCGVGLVHGQSLMPPQASRIYETGVVAWWPSEATKAGDTSLFLMRFGHHDVAIDPRLLMTPGLLEHKEVVLWVEGMILSRFPEDASLPAPESVSPGLTVDRAQQQIISRSSLGSLFPIEIIAVQSLDQFWERYRPLMIGIGSIGLVLIAAWLAVVWRYLSRQFSFETALRAAIGGRRIDAYFQPIVDLSTGRCMGAEILARWKDANGHMISPEVFVPLAEKSGQGTDLTLAVLEKALAQVAPAANDRQPCVYHLNLTEQDLTEPTFARRLAELLHEHGLEPGQFELEITEGSLLDTENVHRRVAELRARGHPIAIDDFGTGFSSLSYLQGFTLDTLKIDKTFVDALHTESVTSSVIRPIIDMAKALELDMVAEGIEAAHQAEWLVAHGVTRGQGYLYSRPLDSKAWNDWYRDHR